MNCPSCGSTNRQAVKETRTGDDGRITRRRRCPDCANDFNTIEQLSDVRLQVRKSDGRVVGFSREAVRRSMVTSAVSKYDPDRINELIDSVIADVYPLADQGTVSSMDVANSVLRHFREIDEVSQVRFALGQIGRRDRSDGRLGWKDVQDFREWLRTEYPQLDYHNSPSRVVDVVKRNDDLQQFDRAKMKHGIEVTAKGRGSPEEVAKLASDVVRDVEDALGDQPRVTTGQIATEIMRSLRRRDHIAYLRFASTAKRFKSAADYEDEAVALIRRTP